MVSRTLRFVSVVPLSPVAIITSWLGNELTQKLKAKILPNYSTSKLLSRIIVAYCAVKVL